MKQKKLYLQNCFASSALIALFAIGAPAWAQSTGAQSTTTTNDANQNPQDNPILRQEVTQFDQFMDAHREIGAQVTKDPSLLDNRQYLQDHPELQTFLNNHPEIRQAVKQSPSAFMWQEHSYEQSEDTRTNDNDKNRADRDRFNQFLDTHREIAEQVRKNPSLVNDRTFQKNHPELEAYLRDNPQTRDEARQDPAAFMRQDDNFDRRDDARSREERNRAELANFDRFLDSHREIAEQVRKNPALLNNQQFEKDHPVLQSYVQQHPAITEEARQNPDAFMHREDQFDRNQNHNDMDRMSSFREFLGNHNDIAQQLYHNPDLAKDQDFIRNHPEYRDYLSAHPDVNQSVKDNPQNFVKMAQQPQFTPADPTAKPSAFDPKAGH